MTKFLKITTFILISLLVLILSFMIFYLVMTNDAYLDEKKLLSGEQNITLYDANGNEIASTFLNNKRKNVEFEDLQQHTIQAFISSEDRTFFQHKGLNYKRMIKAAYRNVMSRSFKEGASTISQQLIKNTHLSGDKTISRKLKEIKLTRKLEKKYSKEQILEMYLNTIYFGHNCYGIESASEFYFDKKAAELTVDESAILAGLIISPNNYSPFRYPEKSIARRNIVLKSMRDCDYLSEREYKDYSSMPLNVAKQKNSYAYGDYINATFEELDKIDPEFYNLSTCFKIYTNLQPELQNLIENLDYPCDNAVIITTKSGEVSAYKSTVGEAKRQPGSTIKPLAVYGPAIEEKIVSPYTKVLDEEIDYNGYRPSNSDNKFHGYVTVTESISKSYNVPAVKTLNSLTIEKSEKYLKKMGIELKDGEKNLSLALGGMEQGLTLKQIADCYAQFSNSGYYANSNFINKIVTKENKTIYENKKTYNKVFSDGTASLMNQILLETTKTGTAKMLRNFDYDIASKTGTCGNEKGNTDAYCINYTSEHCVGVWLGDKNYVRTNISGGTHCCEISKKIFEKIYQTHKPKKLETDKGTKSIDLDAELYYENNKIEIADKFSPLLNILKVKTLDINVPTTVSTRFVHPEIVTPKISVKNNTVKIELRQTKYYLYIIKRVQNGKPVVIYDNKWQNLIEDKPQNGVYTYTVCPYYIYQNEKLFGDEITLPSVNIGEKSKSPQTKPPEIINGNWYEI